MAGLTPLQMVKLAYDEAFRLPADDKLIVDCYMGVLVSAFIPKLSESVWMYWIAPPASGKTLSVSPMMDHSRVMMLSVPTPNALLSGYTGDDGEDPSLIPLLDGKVLIWKDFTALMDQGNVVVNKVVGEFRDCYDQHCSKASGVGGVRSYKSRFGMIACVTDRIDSFNETHQQLGERFLSFRMNRIQQTHQQRVAALDTVIDSMGKKKVWQDKLRNIMHTQVDKLLLKCEKMPTPTFNKDQRLRIKTMADLLALTRTACGETASQAELANRIVQQLINLGHAHAMSDLRTVWNDTEMRLLERVLLDSLSLARRRLVSFMFLQGPHRPAVTREQLIHKCGTTKKQMDTILMQYRFSNVVHTTEGGSQGDVWYRLAPDIYKSIDLVGVLK
jgi:hypothetical protein